MTQEEADFGQLADDLAPEDLLAVLSVFIADVKRLTGNLAFAAATGDAGAFRRVAHGLAGAAGAVGAKALEQACRGAMGRADLAAGDLDGLSTSINARATVSLAQLDGYMARLGHPEAAQG
jgi:HPt (histidine-containing phosphotransfer) domain-containing protein